MAFMGSSPLTRGKPPMPTADDMRGGLIPAHTGKTRFGLPPWPHGRAHPRSRGENKRTNEIQSCSTGSSPLTRGELACDTQGVDVVGLIPTHAGKTRLQTVNRRSAWDHPRSYGENSCDGSRPRYPLGSSPLMRGKRGARGCSDSWPGLIPALAGKTRRS